jgi:hypothetical protein
MGIFQRIYDWLNDIRTPIWLQGILKEMQDIIVASLLQIGKEYLTGLSAKICEVAGNDWTNERKFDAVWAWGKTNIPDVKDAALNLAIEILYALAKKNNFMVVK